MPHPNLIAWQKKRHGVIAIGKCRDASYHLISDRGGRESIFALVEILGSIDYESSVMVPLEDPPRIHVDPAVAQQEPSWFSAVKVVGGGNRKDSITFALKDGPRLDFPADELRQILERPNLGHGEVYLEIPERVGIW